MKRNFMHRKFIFLPYGWKSILPSVCSKKSNIFMFRTRTKTSNISNSNVELERVRPTSGRHGNLVSDELLNQLVKKKDGEKSKSKFIFKYQHFEFSFKCYLGCCYIIRTNLISSKKFLIAFESALNIGPAPGRPCPARPSGLRPGPTPLILGPKKPARPARGRAGPFSALDPS